MLTVEERIRERAVHQLCLGAQLVRDGKLDEAAGRTFVHDVVTDLMNEVAEVGVDVVTSHTWEGYAEAVGGPDENECAVCRRSRRDHADRGVDVTPATTG